MLRAEAARYAADCGISLNALVLIALREYLDQRPSRDPGPTLGPAGGPPTPTVGVQPAPEIGIGRSARRRANRSQR